MRCKLQLKRLIKFSVSVLLTFLIVYLAKPPESDHLARYAFDQSLNQYNQSTMTVEENQPVRQDDANRRVFEQNFTTPIHHIVSQSIAKLPTIFPFFYSYSHTPTFRCNSSSFVIFTLSQPDEIERRNEFRSHIVEPLQRISGSFRNIFVLGNLREHLFNVEQEQRTHNDLLVVPSILESYWNLSLKTHSALQFLKHKYPCNYTLAIKQDVDFRFDETSLRRFASHMEECSTVTAPTIMGRILYLGRVVHREASKWYIPPAVYPSTFYPDYANGPINIWTRSAVDLLADAANGETYFNIEDAYFTGVLREKYNVAIVNVFKQPLVTARKIK